MSGLEGLEPVGVDPILFAIFARSGRSAPRLEQDEVLERQVQGLDTNSLLHSQPNDYTKKICASNWRVTR